MLWFEMGKESYERELRKRTFSVCSVFLEGFRALVYQLVS